jgi:acyl homoserine lactone synthase
MIAVGSRAALSPQLIASMHEFRKEIFVKRMGWSLPLVDGVERDSYDNEDAVYFTVQDLDDRMTACARLLPTTRPYMLADLFPHLVSNTPVPHDATVWELGRFATDVRKTGAGRVLSLSQPTLDLLEAIMTYSRRHGVRQLVLVTAVAIERLVLRAGFHVHRLGAPERTETGLMVACVIEVAAGPDTESFDAAASCGVAAASATQVQ